MTAAMARAPLPCAFALCALLAGCGAWPELDLPEPESAGYPTLVPFDRLAGLGDTSPEEAEARAEAEAGLEARGAALRARAAEPLPTPEDRAALAALRARRAPE